MPTHPVQLSEELYQRLSEHAAQMQLTPEQLLEHLLTGDLARAVLTGDDGEIPVPPAGSDEALAAVQRLATLFADVAMADLDQVLADPLIALANADAGTLAHDS